MRKSVNKNKLMTSEKLQRELEAYLEKGVTMVDAILTYATSNNIDIESIAGLVKKSPAIKDMLKIEGEKTFLLKRE